MTNKKIFTALFIFCTLILQANGQGSSPDSVLQYGNQLFEAKKHAEAIDFLKSNENQFENADAQKQANYYALLGKTYFNLRKYPEAEEAMLKAIDIA